MNTIERIKDELRHRATGTLDQRGYTATARENVFAGIDWQAVESELRRGSGNELGGKFRAVHSSSALAVNVFGRFKSRADELLLFGQRGARSVEFEKQFHIIPGRNPSNLDVWIDCGSHAIAVESKFLELFQGEEAGLCSGL